ncbi:hypothetical protein KAT92_03215, partial [Candidatus Babeliales bacterium]|nr:hypothetical protein [Candidatus Babeliales bacterium]
MRTNQLTRYLFLLLSTVPTLDASVKIQATGTIAFGPNAFESQSYYYLGATSGSAGTSALSRVYLEIDPDTDPQVTTAKFQTLAPAKAFVNNPKKDTESDNPIYDGTVSYLSLMGQLPVAVLNTRNAAYSHPATAGTDQTLCLLENALDGSQLSVNTVKLKDANATPADTNGIRSIAASSSYIFAAVRPNGGTFGATDSGIAVVKRGESDLTPMDATTGLAGNKALAVNGGTNVTINDHVAMHWDATLQRLFVGLHVKHALSPATGHGLWVGRLETDKPKLTLASAVKDTAIGASEAVDKIIAFNSDTITNMNVKIYNIKTMHTSTGKSYVIVNGVTSSAAVPQTTIFALPIVRKQYSDKDVSAEKIGRITDKFIPGETPANNENSITQAEPVTLETKMTNYNDEAAKVGRSIAPNDIQDMFVVGDSVFVCCAHATDKDKQGIFQSTAIFNKDGLIQEWTAWQRAMGAIDKVNGAAMDTNNGQFWYLTQTTNPFDTVKTTLWGQKDATVLGSLRTKLEEEFKQETGGIHQLFNFDSPTVGFNSDNFSLAIATGYQKAALVRTGKQDSGTFIPTLGTDFNSVNISNNVKIKTDTTIQDIGSLCCAEVSRSNTLNKGWIFVGGYNGVAVLRDGSTGNGWDGSAGLSNLTPTLDNFSFKTIGSFKHVHKLACNGAYLYVLTPSALHRIEMTAGKFKDTTPDALGAEIIAQPTYTDLTTCDANDSLLDFVISAKLGLLATTGGLYRTSNGSNIAGIVANAREWTEVQTTVDSQSYTIGPITHLSPVSKDPSSFIHGGNLYIVAGNISTDLSSIFRFTIADTTGDTIDDETVQQIAEQKSLSTDNNRDHFYNIGEFRST